MDSYSKGEADKKREGLVNKAMRMRIMYNYTAPLASVNRPIASAPLSLQSKLSSLAAWLGVCRSLHLISTYSFCPDGQMCLRSLADAGFEICRSFMASSGRRPAVVVSRASRIFPTCTHASMTSGRGES